MSARSREAAPAGAAPALPGEAPPVAARGWSPERRREMIQKFAAFGGLVILVAAFSMSSPAFATVGNALTVSLQVTSIAILGIGMTCVIITGGIDLSVGSILALAGVVAALAVHRGLAVWCGMLLGLLAGAACGTLNGLVVTRLRLPPFIATLGMMMVARGLALQITGAEAVSGLGQGFGVLGNGSLFRVESIGADGFPEVSFPGIPYPVVIMVVLMVLVSLMLTRTVLGRHIHAVGSNTEAARLSGVNVQRVTLFAYALSGTMAGLTGCILMSRLVTGQPNEGIAYELDAVAAAVIGGTSLIGGIGTISGTAIGSFIIGILRNGLNMNGVSAFTQQILIGLVILFTVWIDQLRNRH